MNLSNAAQRLVPSAVKGKVKQFIRKAAPLTANKILDSLYTPLPFEAAGENKLVWSRSTADAHGNGSLPIPPAELRMSYNTDSGEGFLASGKYAADWLHRLAGVHSINLLGRSLEWGCATGRVLRHFEAEAKVGEFWGTDQAGPHIAWCKDHLCPPFRFVTCTAYPHLPFADNTFDFVYGISIFTHLVHLIDAWLMEFRRILAPGGHAIFTIMDEHTIGYFREVPEDRPDWLSADDVAAGLSGDIMLFGGNDWGHSFTLFRTDWVKREWGQYLDVISIEPRAEAYQSAVVLAKR